MDRNAGVGQRAALDTGQAGAEVRQGGGRWEMSILSPEFFDVTKGGYLEYKSGASMLDSSYQLRLQTYRSVTTETPFSIVTTRPVNPRFQQSLDFWGVNVVPPK
jgi:hypothetical protein